MYTIEYRPIREWASVFTSCANCLMSSLLEWKVVNVPFAFLCGFNVLHTKPRPPYSNYDVTSSACNVLTVTPKDITMQGCAGYEFHLPTPLCRITMLILLALRALPVELHKLLAWMQGGKCFVCLSLWCDVWNHTIRLSHVSCSHRFQ